MSAVVLHFIRSTHRVPYLNASHSGQTVRSMKSYQQPSIVYGEFSYQGGLSLMV